jgi:hypothetical protein
MGLEDGPDPQQQEDAIRVLLDRVIELSVVVGAVEVIARRERVSAGEVDPIPGWELVLEQCRRVIWTPASSPPGEPF